MGYRLDIQPKSDFENRTFKNAFCFGKLYGYVQDEHELKSYQYLINLGLLNGDEWWDDCCSNQVELTPEQMKEFLKYYIEEKAEFNNLHNYAQQQEMKKVFEDYKNKLLAFNENVILEWG